MNTTIAFTMLSKTLAEQEKAGIVMTFGAMFADVCPPSLTTLEAGRINHGLFHPYGSVARHFFALQQQENKKKAVPSVYFIRCGDAVKIGSARNIAQRLDSLQCASPVELHLIGIITHGGRPLERQLHKRFSKHRLRGEWFSCCDEILAYVSEFAQ